MATRSKWQHLATEAVNPRSRDIDTLTPDEIVEVMILDNRHVLAAVQREKTRIARGAELRGRCGAERRKADLRRRRHERQAWRARSGGAAARRSASTRKRRRRSWPEGRPRCIERKRGSKTITKRASAPCAAFGPRAKMSSSAFRRAASRRSCGVRSRERARREGAASSASPAIRDRS